MASDTVSTPVPPATTSQADPAASAKALPAASDCTARARRHKVALTGGLILVGLALGSALHALDDSVSLLVDLEVDKGSRVELFYNDVWTASLQIPLTPGRRTYRFDGLPRILWDIRLDPTDVANANVRLHGISILDGDTRLRSLDAQALRNWKMINGAAASDSRGGALEFVSSNEDPMLMCPDRFDFVGDHKLRYSITNWLSPKHLWLLFAAAFVLTSGWFGRYATAQLPVALVAVILVLHPIAHRIGLSLGGMQDVDLAVGWSNYHGYRKNGELNLFFFYFAFCGLASVALGLVARWRASSGHARNAAADSSLQSALAAPQTSRWSRWLPAALLLGYALLDFPPLQGILVSYPGATHDLAWDSMNVFTWRYSVFQGWVPLRDFWFPYGGFYNFQNVFPSGFLEAHFHQLILLAVLGYSTYRLGHRSIVLCSLVLLVTMLGPEAGRFARTERYILGLDVVLLGLVVAQEPQARWAALFAVYAAYVFAYEPNQLFYGGTALAGVFALELLWPPPSTDRRASRRALVRIGFAALVGVGFMLLVFAKQGRLRGLWTLVRQMKPIAIYGSLSSEILEWLVFEPQTPHLLLWGALLLVSFGLGLRAYATGAAEQRAARISLAMGLLAATATVKEVVRHGLSNQLIIYVVVGAIVVLHALRSSLRPAQLAVLLVGAGFAVGAGSSSAQWARALGGAGIRMANLPDDLRVLARTNVELHAIQADYFYSEKRYPRYLPLVQRLKQLTGYRPGIGPESKFYVLGDDSVLYVALQQKPPYYVSYYSESPIDAQLSVAEWLDLEKPEFVVWLPGYKEFDGVPHLARVPIVFDAIIASYQPLESLGEYEILQRRPDGAPFPLEYWHSKLGSTVDLGALPARSSLRSSIACHMTLRGCVDALKVTLKDAQTHGSISVPIQVGTDHFNLRLSLVEGTTEYIVNLHWLWFWGNLKRLGYTPELGATPANLELALTQLASSATLY